MARRRRSRGWIVGALLCVGCVGGAIFGFIVVSSILLIQYKMDPPEPEKFQIPNSNEVTEDETASNKRASMRKRKKTKKRKKSEREQKERLNVDSTPPQTHASDHDKAHSHQIRPEEGKMSEPQDSNREKDDHELNAGGAVHRDAEHAPHREEADHVADPDRANAEASAKRAEEEATEKRTADEAAAKRAEEAVRRRAEDDAAVAPKRKAADDAVEAVRMKAVGVAAKTIKKADHRVPISESSRPDGADGAMKRYLGRYEKFAAIRPNPARDNSIFDDHFASKALDVCEDMRKTYPMVHGSVLLLAHRFLLLKRKFGSGVEQTLYGPMTITDFFDRLITKRAIMFYYNGEDQWLLRNGKRGTGNWDLVGTENENKDGPHLAENLSYDEIQISALLGVSSPTHFINNCNRHNVGVWGQKGSFEPHGIFQALVGMRFVKPKVMDYALMMVTVDQNTKKNGYGQGTQYIVAETVGDLIDDAEFVRSTERIINDMDGNKKSGDVPPLRIVLWAGSPPGLR